MHKVSFIIVGIPGLGYHFLMGKKRGASKNSLGRSLTKAPKKKATTTRSTVCRKQINYEFVVHRIWTVTHH